MHLQRDPVVFSGREPVDVVVPKPLHHSRQLSVIQPVIVDHHPTAPGALGPSAAVDESGLGLFLSRRVVIETSARCQVIGSFSSRIIVLLNLVFVALLFDL